MEKITKEEFDELNAICEKITILKLERIKKFGKNWQLKLNGFGKKKRVKSKIDQTILNNHIRKIEETMVLKNWTIGKTCGTIGLSRNTYRDLRNGMCSSRVHRILSNINWDSL